jgi:hypothetical protein
MGLQVIEAYLRKLNCLLLEGGGSNHDVTRKGASHIKSGTICSYLWSTSGFSRSPNPATLCLQYWTHEG